MSEPSSSSRPVDEASEGFVGTQRGIRAGKKAKRRRDAFIRHESERLQVDASEIPVVHQGGQQRPLHTPRIWSPAPSEVAEEDQVLDTAEQEQVILEVSSEEEAVDLAQEVQPVWLGPRPRIPRAQGTSSSSPTVRSPSLPPGYQIEFLNSRDLPGVRVWSVDNNFRPREIWLEEVPVIRGQGKLIAVDWHQVTDVCRYSKYRNIHCASNGQVPADIATFYEKVKRRLGPEDLLVIISHIERSEDNLQRVLRGVRQSRLPVAFIFITEKRTGPGGKTDVAQDLLRSVNLLGRASICDDNLEVSEEFCAAGGTVFHIKKPSLRGQLPWHCGAHPDRCKSAWNVLEHFPDLERFLSIR